MKRVKKKKVELNKEVHRIRDDLIQTGRSKNVSVVSTGHQLMDYKKTRNLLTEAHAVVFYPTCGAYHIERYLKTYAGLSREMIKKILALKSRWIYFHKNFPQYIISQHKAFLV